MNKSLRNLKTIIGGILLVAFCNVGLFGCMAGNYNALRTVAKWNNKFSILPRVLIYIVFIIIPIYPIAGLIDVIVANTIEFWTGDQIIKAQNKKIEKDGQTVEIAHSRAPLRNTTITTTAKNGTKSVTEIRETEQKIIEVYVDGIKTGEIADIEKEMPKLITYAPNGIAPLERHDIDQNKLEYLATGKFSESRGLLEATIGLNRTDVACSK